ncbi:hypothetical protein NP233_g12520 [Leucocoprinus birnbaumii]|uniref:Uncharacterized protein n=1 Tax=Leucocoprinus birnbaumii TaxID=56174 RepID=A0AAD5YPY5_9AGAR|nr:hypothetical protein NP233_g12520 [Leucocoprinus birnbaumii]
MRALVESPARCAISKSIKDGKDEEHLEFFTTSIHSPDLSQESPPQSMIIDSLSPDKDIEAQRGTGPSMSGAQAALVDPSTSTSASGPMNHPYDYTRADDTANEGDRLLEDTSDSLPGTYPASNPLPTPGPQFQEPLGPPPEFTPYEAEWFEVGQGDVVSHDEHLNTDGEALYRFLLTQATQRPPGYRIRCQGSHNETRYRFVTGHDHGSHNNGHHHHHGRSNTRTESYTERVTDFDFYIDVTPPIPSQQTPPPQPLPPVDSKTRTGQPPSEEHHTNPNDDYAPIHWSVADNEPVYRGKMVEEIEAPVTSNTRGPIALPEGDLPLLAPSAHLHQSNSHTRKASRRERKDYAEWVKQRRRKGIPPWAFPQGVPDGQWAQAAIVTAASPSNMVTSDRSQLAARGVLKSSKTVREWADAYCSSPKLLKEFIYTKVLYGWDITQLETAIRSTISLAPYHGDIQVTFTPINSKIYVRPSNWLSRMLSNVWIKFVSILLLIYPFIWLFKRFNSKGGGKWEVCGGAYALKRWVPLDAPQHPPALNQGDSSPNGNNDLPSYDDIAGPSTLASPTITSTSVPFSPSTNPTSLGLLSSPSTSSPSPHPHLHANSLPQTRIIQTPSGPYKLIGQREGEWFRYWEPVILRAVITRYQSNTPLTLYSELHGRHATPGSALEGYHDAPMGANLPPGGGIIPGAPASSLDGYNSPYGSGPRNQPR